MNMHENVPQEPILGAVLLQRIRCQTRDFSVEYPVLALGELYVYTNEYTFRGSSAGGVRRCYRHLRKTLPDIL